MAARKLLIVYGTTEGQTRKIAGFLAEEALGLNCPRDVYDAEMIPEDFQLSQYSNIIVAASVHVERHQPSVAQFVKKHRLALEKCETAFLSVSLSAAGDAEERSEAWEYTRRFLSETEWRPTKVHIVAGALRFSEHDFFKRWAMRRLAKEKRADRNSDHEYTNWPDLWRFLKDFLGPAL